MAKQPNLIYQVAVGEVPAFYHTCIDSVARYAGRIGAKHIVQREPILRIAPLKSARSANALRLGYLPIYEKENAFRHLGRHDSVLILDADVYVKDSAPNIFDIVGSPFSGVAERDMPLTVQYRQKVMKHSLGQFDNLRDVEWDWNERGADYFNMGVMLLHKGLHRYLHNQTPDEFLRRPEFEGFINGEGHWRWSTDQTLLNYWLKLEKVPTTHLDWRWNGLYGANPQALDAHFVHFFLAAKLPKKGVEIPSIIDGL